MNSAIQMKEKQEFVVPIEIADKLLRIIEEEFK
jgi:hypothetical protein